MDDTTVPTLSKTISMPVDIACEQHLSPGSTPPSLPVLPLLYIHPLLPSCLSVSFLVASLPLSFPLPSLSLSPPSPHLSELDG